MMAQLTTKGVGAPRDISSLAECDAFLASQVNATVLFFWAAWHEPSKPGSQMDQVMRALAAQHGPSLSLAKVCPVITTTLRKTTISR